MVNDPHYDAVLSRAGVYLNRAWDDFIGDPKIPWREGNVPLAQERMWIDALKHAAGPP